MVVGPSCAKGLSGVAGGRGEDGAVVTRSDEGDTTFAMLEEEEAKAVEKEKK